ncbi:RING finger protein [Francisella sp. SYW-9]|uniref:RING finger protein n=1 Tax=Francisella sp. SYW-9 TaxID=2610888 RepID=UPI00123D23FD|nr:RING finger protein [Francisella sp. SYW-9]
MKDECSICLNDIEKDESTATTLCNHIFHHECITKWIKQERKKSCPICREYISRLKVKIREKITETDKIFTKVEILEINSSRHINKKIEYEYHHKGIEAEINYSLQQSLQESKERGNYLIRNSRESTSCERYLFVIIGNLNDIKEIINDLELDQQMISYVSLVTGNQGDACDKSLKIRINSLSDLKKVSVNLGLHCQNNILRNYIRVAIEKYISWVGAGKGSIFGHYHGSRGKEKARRLLKIIQNATEMQQIRNGVSKFFNNDIYDHRGRLIGGRINANPHSFISFLLNEVKENWLSLQSLGLTTIIQDTKDDYTRDFSILKIRRREAISALKKLELEPEI